MRLIQDFSTLQQAFIVKGVLAENGIDTFLEEGVLASVFPAPDSGNSHVELFVVDDDDYPKACALIHDHFK